MRRQSHLPRRKTFEGLELTDQLGTRKKTNFMGAHAPSGDSYRTLLHVEYFQHLPGRASTGPLRGRLLVYSVCRRHYLGAPDRARLMDLAQFIPIVSSGSKSVRPCNGHHTIFHEGYLTE